MATSKKFSELPAASSVGNGDLFAIAHEDALAETGYVSQKLTAAQAGQKVNGDTEYPTSLPSFPTGSQNPFDALEKLNADIDSLYPVNTASGSIATFTTSLAKPLTALSSTIVAQQAGTGTPSPSNPRSISGVSSVSFYQRGVNLWDEEWEQGLYNNQGVKVPNTNAIRAKNPIVVKPNMVYRIVGLSGGNRICYYDGTGAFLSTKTQVTTDTVPSNAYFMTFSTSTTHGGTYNNDISVNYPSTDTSYHAYNSQSETKTIALGQTVYGGSVDAKNGKATITRGFADLSTLNWTYSSNQNGWYTDDIKNDGIFQYNNVTWMSDIWNPHVWTGRAEGDMVCNSSKTLFCLTSDTVNTPTGVIVYELATPIEITGLTPANFTTFAGENNIFSDCGDISVSFKQGIQEYIDAKIAETQALIL